MKMFRFSTLCLIISIVAISLTAQGSYMNKLNEKLPIDKNYKIGKLDNGLTYFIRENNKPESRAELQIVVRAGAVQEDDNQQGLAHFIEHMCFNGTKDFPKNELVKFLESTGVRFGADVNANTGFDRTYYMITIPLDKEGLLDKGMSVLQNWLSEVSFDPEELEKERGVIIEEWRLRMNAQSRLFEKHFPYIGYGTKTSKRLPIGDTAVIKTAPRERFTTFYKDFYRPDIAAVIMVGDFKIADIEPKIIKMFSGLKNPTLAKPIIIEQLPIHKETFVSIAVDKEMPFTNVSFYFKHQGKENSLTYGEYREKIITSLMNQMLAKRLDELVKKANPPYQRASADYSKFFVGDAYAFGVDVITKNDNFNGGVESALTEVFRAQKHGFTKGELDRAKTEYIKFFETAYNEKDKTESNSYAMECYRFFHENESMPGIELEYDLVKNYVPSVTLDEVNKLMAKMVTNDGVVITVSAPDKPEVKIPSKDEILAMYNKVKNANVEAYKDAATDKPLMAKKPTPGKITDMKKIPGIDIIEMKLSNGAKVILKPTTFKNDQILMRAYGLGGTSLADDKDFYSAQLAGNIIDESGIAEFDAITLEKMLTGKTANINPMVAGLTEGFSGNCAPNDMETMFQLLNLYFTNPRKDPESFKSFLGRQSEMIRNSRSNPESTFRDSVNVIMTQNHFRGRPWTDEALASVNLDKAFNFYKSVFANAADFTFVFVGNIDLEKFNPMIETYIASLPSSPQTSKWKDIGLRSPKSSIKKEVKKGIEPKSTVRLSITGNYEYNRQNNFDLEAMVEVLNIRLLEVIREDKSGVYGIGARPQMNQFPVNDYSISISFGCAPDRAQELIGAVKDILTDFINKPVEANYVQKVSEIMKRQDEVNFKENNWWLGALYTYDFNNLDKQNIIKKQELVAKLTVADVQKSAAKYLKMNSIIECVLMPE